MPAAELQPDVVTARLERIVELVGVLYEIDDSLVPERIGADMLLRLALERALTRLVDLATSINTHIAATLGVRVPTDARGAFAAAAEAGAIRYALAEQLDVSVTISKVLAGDVAASDWDLILGSVPDTRYDYQMYVREISAWLTQQAA